MATTGAVRYNDPMTEFPLEGAGRNLIAALSGRSTAAAQGQRLFPDLRDKLLPALEVTELTLDALGEAPTPADVDRSNLRRLLRAVRPILVAYGDLYADDVLARCLERMDTVESALGRFKDVAVIEAELRAVSDDALDAELTARLAGLRARRARAFRRVYRRFRERGARALVASLSTPEVPRRWDAPELRRRGTQRQRRLIESRLAAVVEHGVIHERPIAFHDARKALRRLLATCEAFPESAAMSDAGLTTLRRMVRLYGRAGDAHTALVWVRLQRQAIVTVRVKRRYADAQLAALLAARDWPGDAL